MKTTFKCCSVRFAANHANCGPEDGIKKRTAIADSNSPFGSYVLVVAVAVVCYLNGLNGDFVHDDIPAVTMNKDVLAVSPIGHVFRNDFWGTPMADLNSHKSYRPLTTLTFRANYVCFGLQPMWFHATNIALHAIACVLFTRVCFTIAGLGQPFATIAGVLFAAHPIHTEAVTGIVGRADVLACIFFLFSLLAYHGQPAGCKQVWASVVLGGLSMLAKETGITVFLLNLIYDFYRCWPSIKRVLVELRWNEEACLFARRATKVVMSLGILLAVRLALLQGSLPKFSQQDNPTAFHPSIYVRLLTFSYLAAFNWWLLLCPATLSHDWQMGSVPLLVSAADCRNLVTCAFFGCALLLTYRCLQDFEAHKHVPLVLGLLLLVLPFLPATNLVVTVGFVVAERVLYIPSLGGVLLVVYGLQLLWNTYVRHRHTLICFGLLLLIVSCFRVVIRNRDWRSRESLLRAGMATLPHNAKMHYNYANFLRDSARPELAITHYHKALQLWPSYASAHNNLGTLIPEKEEAEIHFLSAIRFSADHINAHYNLGQLYRKSNRTAESARMLERCIKLDPTFSPAYLELARLRGPADLSVGGLLKQVVTLNPKDPHHITTYANWLLGRGQYLIALKYYWSGLSLEPTYEGAMLGASKTLRKQGQYARLLQLITRWQFVKRLQRGDPPLSPHLYLHGWLLKTELSHKARAYDPCPTVLCGRRCVAAKSPRFNPVHQHSYHGSSQHPMAPVSHPACNRTSRSPKCFATVRQCRITRHRWQYKNRPTTPLMVHHLLDAV